MGTQRLANTMTPIVQTAMTLHPGPTLFLIMEIRVYMNVWIAMQTRLQQVITVMSAVDVTIQNRGRITLSITPVSAIVIAATRQKRPSTITGANVLNATTPRHGRIISLTTKASQIVLLAIRNREMTIMAMHNAQNVIRPRIGKISSSPTVPPLLPAAAATSRRQVTGQDNAMTVT